MELIFALLLIAILTSVALPKFFGSSDKGTIIKLQSELLVIQNGIKNYKEKQNLGNTNTPLTTLDGENGDLFGAILQRGIPPALPYPSWRKKSAVEYPFYFDQARSLLFTYDPSTMSFSCDTREPLCQEVLE